MKKILEISNSNINKILQLASKNDYILLGESTHGTSEFYAIRLYITIMLVSSYNFNTIFLETEWSSGYKLNKFIHSKLNMDAKTLLKTWGNSDETAINITVEKYNDSIEYNCGFTGNEKVLSAKHIGVAVLTGGVSLAGNAASAIKDDKLVKQTMEFIENMMNSQFSKDASNAVNVQNENDIPQPQEDFVLGFDILNEFPINSSEKSTSEPLSISSEELSITILSFFWSFLSILLSKVKSYLKPEHPPPLTAILKNVPEGFVDTS